MSHRASSTRLILIAVLVAGCGSRDGSGVDGSWIVDGSGVDGSWIVDGSDVDGSWIVDGSDVDGGGRDGGGRDASDIDIGGVDGGSIDGGVDAAASCLLPVVERCNGYDDDCDGVVDNGASLSCGGNYVCRSGSCVCPLTCYGHCVDPTRDSQHCGACGNVCQDRSTCVNGACECGGEMPSTCGGTCVDLASDNENCGACGNVCPKTQYCLGGACQSPRPRCDGLPATCGAGGKDDCCESPLVSGGRFYRSYDAAADGFRYANQLGAMLWPATVSDFRLDRYEITTGRYRAFIAAVDAGWRPVDGQGENPYLGGGGWNYDGTRWSVDWDHLAANTQCGDFVPGNFTFDPGANENQPMNCINWYEAFAFCAWDGGFLPTEAEWNYAAAGGAEQRAYPWSMPAWQHTFDDAYAVVDSALLYVILPSVGSRSPQGDGRYGQSDLAGSVWEWVLDWNAGSSNPPSYTVDPCVDCADLTGGTRRVIRGGGFYAYNASEDFTRTAYRTSMPPGYRSNLIGARCARAR